MKKKHIIDPFSLFINFQKEVLQSKPTLKNMYEEILMMRFKIRPLYGDISVLNLKDSKLIETLWNLGKLDELFQKESDNLTGEARRTFLHLFNDLHQRYQNQLNALNLKQGDELTLASPVEMEIFKEEVTAGKLN